MKWEMEVQEVSIPVKHLEERGHASCSGSKTIAMIFLNKNHSFSIITVLEYPEMIQTKRAFLLTSNSYFQV